MYVHVPARAARAHARLALYKDRRQLRQRWPPHRHVGLREPVLQELRAVRRRPELDERLRSVSLEVSESVEACADGRCQTDVCSEVVKMPSFRGRERSLCGHTSDTATPYTLRTSL